MDICLLWVSCVVRYQSLRRADRSSRGVLPTMVRRCVWSRNIKNRCSIYIHDISSLRVKGLKFAFTLYSIYNWVHSDTCKDGIYAIKFGHCGCVLVLVVKSICTPLTLPINGRSKCLRCWRGSRPYAACSCAVLVRPLLRLVCDASRSIHAGATYAVPTQRVAHMFAVFLCLKHMITHLTL